MRRTRKSRAIGDSKQGTPKFFQMRYLRPDEYDRYRSLVDKTRTGTLATLVRKLLEGECDRVGLPR